MIHSTPGGRKKKCRTKMTVESHNSNASSIPVSVVTGASEGIGRAYAFEVSAYLSGITCISMDFSVSIHFCIGHVKKF